MFETWFRSFQLVKQSYAILKKDREMLLFPIISMTAIVLLFISYIIPFKAITGVDLPAPVDLTFLVAFYLISYFIIVFFNVGLISCARIRLNGGDPTFKDGITNASKHLHSILLWSMISATVGLILTMLTTPSKKRSLIQDSVVGFFRSILGMAWTLLTFFVIPVMIFENKGVFQSIKSSGQLFKKTWGETAVGSASINLIFGALALPGIFGFIGMLWCQSCSVTTRMGMLAAAILYWVILGISSSTLSGIFRTVLYEYATNGKVHEGFDTDRVQNAFA
jgi:hypothetical protein